VGGTEDIAALVREAQEAYDTAQQALRDGDFAGYGAQIQRLEQLLDRLAELTSQEEGSQ
jgi:flagellin-specific chaperone FliS